MGNGYALSLKCPSEAYVARPRSSVGSDIMGGSGKSQKSSLTGISRSFGV